MSVNPIDENSTPKHTGSLEELFRHHLGEEAAVPPRPMLWEQIDNSLLIRQNEQYRKRLAATRWVAAASLLLASLAGTGWWFGQHNQAGDNAELARNRQSAPGARPATEAGRPANATPTYRGLAGATDQNTTIASATPAGTDNATNRTTGTPGRPAPAGASRSYGAARRIAALGDNALAARANEQSTGRYSGFGQASARFQTAGRSAAFASSTGSVSSALAAREAATATTADGQATAATELNASSLSTPALTASGAVVAGAEAGNEVNTGIGTVAAPMPAETGWLAGRQAALQLGAATALPAGLGTVPVEEPAKAETHRWRYGASYAISAFNPNINFSRAGIEPAYDYDPSPAFGENSPALTEAAATEYRNNLRTGLSQRIALMATRHLRGHWSLSTGVEFAQATAKSASSSAFVGEQLFDLSQGGTERPLRTTDFRYRMASIPLEMRYANPAKRGWSLYGRLGGMVTALLGVRSDVTGDPEATRTYTIASAGTPYRRVTGSLRAGAGTQFRPSTGRWALTMGPVAEIGLLSLNAHPAQSYFAQSHPYSVGLEAGVEFGR